MLIVTNIVPANQIEEIVGRKRHRRAHFGRAVRDGMMLYILHSQNCLEDTPDLRDCPFSLAADRGISLDAWKDSMDKPVHLMIRHGKLRPVLIGLR